jgi:hypothetical protein
VNALILALSLTAVVPVETIVSERCDLIEVNHFYSPEGHKILTQLIFYDWHVETLGWLEGWYEVRDWRLVRRKTVEKEHDKDHMESMLPVLDHTGLYHARWSDNKELREVSAPVVRETWTQYDPELIDRSRLPVNARRGLLINRTEDR